MSRPRLIGLAPSLGAGGLRSARSRTAPASTRGPWVLTAVRDGLLVALPLSMSIALAGAYAHNHAFAGDYQVNAYTAGHDLFHHLTLYASPGSPLVKHFALFDWGAAAAVLFAPLSLLPAGVANVLFALFCMASVAGALAVLGIRDWRIYCTVLMWPFVMLGWVLGNVELPMTLGLALAWRYRDRAVIVGAVLAVLISIKFIVFPVAIWLIATRRYGALKYTIGWALLINLAAWAIAGFGEIPRYLALLPAVAKIARPRGTGIVSLCIHLGASTAVATVVSITIAAALAVLAIRAGRRHNDLAAFGLAVVACLAATPIMEPLYYTLLLVPLAIARPRFGLIWATPLLLWASLMAGGRWGTAGSTLVCLGVTACLLAPALSHQGRRLTPA